VLLLIIKSNFIEPISTSWSKKMKVKKN
jgi:hypothetical protein